MSRIKNISNLTFYRIFAGDKLTKLTKLWLLMFSDNGTCCCDLFTMTLKIFTCFVSDKTHFQTLKWKNFLKKLRIIISCSLVELLVHETKCDNFFQTQTNSPLSITFPRCGCCPQRWLLLHFHVPFHVLLFWQIDKVIAYCCKGPLVT